ncbi:hypothetical protein ACLOJK_011639 [Asimina triloba]
MVQVHQLEESETNPSLLYMRRLIKSGPPACNAATHESTEPEKHEETEGELQRVLERGRMRRPSENAKSATIGADGWSDGCRSEEGRAASEIERSEAIFPHLSSRLIHLQCLRLRMTMSAGLKVRQ